MSYDISGEHKLLNWKCVRHIKDEDSVLVGKYGHISKYGDKGSLKNLYFVTFWSPQVAKRWGVEIAQGEEGGTIVNEETAKTIRKDLKTFRCMKQQLKVLLENGG